MTENNNNERVFELPADESPKTGEFVDSEKFFEEITLAEQDAGKEQGEQIDPDDDNDGGEVE